MKDQLQLFALLLFALVLTGYGINWTELEEWDEARRGVNALRMLQTGDYWNYRYLDHYDAFNTKPPLFTWLVAGAFCVFGVKIFALRVVSLLALLGFVAVVYKFLKRYKGALVARLTVLVLLLCNGIAGTHVGRSGDTDMLFVFFLTVGLLQLFRFFEAERLRCGVYAVLSLGLAFLTKGLAVALVVPGLLVYVFVKRGKLFCSKRKTLVLAVFFVLTAATCWLLCRGFGKATEYKPDYANLWQAMFLHDGLTRFTDGGLEKSFQWDYLLVSLDIRFFPWIYLLYAGAVYGLFRMRWAGLKRIVLADDFLMFSLLMALSVSGLLLMSQNKHQWYIAPMLLFLAYPVALLLRKIKRRKHFIWRLVPLLFLVPLALKVKTIHQSFDPVRQGVSLLSEELLITDSLSVSLHTPQHLLFHCYLINPEIRIVTKQRSSGRKLQKGECSDDVLGYCLWE